MAVFGGLFSDAGTVEFGTDGFLLMMHHHAAAMVAAAMRNRAAVKTAPIRTAVKSSAIPE